MTSARYTHTAFPRTIARAIMCAAVLSTLVLVSSRTARAQSVRANGRAAGITRADQSQHDTTFAVDRGAVLDLTAVSAGIVVRGADRSDMEVLSGLSGARISGTSKTVRIEKRPSGRSSGDDGKLEIAVPRETRVLVHARTGNVELVDVSGAIDVDVVAGNVKVERSIGRINITVVAGNISLVSAEGPVHVGAVSGDVLIEDVRGDLEVSGTSSEVTLRRVRSNRVSAALVSGSVSFDGALFNNGRYEFTSHSGNVRLYVSEDASGEIEVQSFNGELHTSIPLTTVADGSPAPPDRGAKGARNYSLNARQRFEFGGGGGAQVIISTFSGDVTIARGPRR